MSRPYTALERKLAQMASDAATALFRAKGNPSELRLTKQELTVILNTTIAVSFETAREAYIAARIDS